MFDSLLEKNSLKICISTRVKNVRLDLKDPMYDWRLQKYVYYSFTIKFYDICIEIRSHMICVYSVIRIKKHVQVLFGN